MASISPKAREAIACAQRGEVARAILVGEAAAAETPDNPGLRLFLGMLHARRADLAQALPHVERAAALLPADPLPRLELARLLAGLDRIDDAERALAGLRVEGSLTIELQRIRALILQRRGAHGDAAALYRDAVRRDDRDFESWGQLGACLLAMGDCRGAIAALERALALRPDQPTVRARLAEAQATAGEGEQGLAVARAAAASLPYDPMIRVAIARLEDLLGRPEAAEAALEDALSLDVNCAPALLALAELKERGNRIEGLEGLIRRIETIGVPPAETALLRARLRYRRGDLKAALATALAVPAAADGGARAQLIGQIRDRLGDHRAAFAAFAEMNRATALHALGTQSMAASYRASIQGRTRALARLRSESGSASHP